MPEIPYWYLFVSKLKVFSGGGVGGWKSSDGYFGSYSQYYDMSDWS